MLFKKTTILSLSSVSALKIDPRNLVSSCLRKRSRSQANALILHERKKWFQTMSLVWNSNTFDQLYALSIWLCKWRQWGDIKSRTKNSVSGPLFFNTWLPERLYWIDELSYGSLRIFLFTALIYDAIHSWKLAVGRLFRCRLILVKDCLQLEDKVQYWKYAAKKLSRECCLREILLKQYQNLAWMSTSAITMVV